MYREGQPLYTQYGSTDDPGRSFLKLDAMGITGCGVLAINMFMATLGGVGGTSTIFPITLIFFDFSIKVAVSHTALFGFVSTAGRVIYEILSTVKKPENKRINYHIVLLAAPIMSIGSVIGVKLNQMSPSIIVLSGMTVLLVFLMILSVKKFRKKRAVEKLTDQEGEDNPVVSTTAAGDYKSLAQTATVDHFRGDGVPTLGEITIREDLIQQKLSCFELLILLFVASLDPILCLLRGTPGTKSVIGLELCSKEDWLIISAYLYLNILIVVIIGRRIIKKSEKLRESSKKQIKFTPKKVLTMSLGILVMSIVGSFLAAGSSTLFSLFLIFQGLSSFISSPTALVLACITSGSSAVLYLMDGQIHTLAGVLGSVIIVIFSIGTRVTIYKKLMKNGKESVIILFIIILVSVAIPSNLLKALPPIIKRGKEGKDIWKIDAFCSFD